MSRPAAMTTLSGWCAPASRAGALEECSLIIATYNRHSELMRQLNALLEVPDPPAEVVVVDGRPEAEFSDRLRDWTGKHAIPFDLRYVESPPGLTRQRNVGVDISTRDYLFFLDDDAVPLPGYFAEMRRVLMEDRERHVGGLAGCVINGGLRAYFGARPKILPGYMPWQAKRVQSGSE